MSNHHRPRPWFAAHHPTAFVADLAVLGGCGRHNQCRRAAIEVVGEAHNVAQSSPDDPSLQAMKRIGKVFHEFDSDSAAMIVLEGDKPLGNDAHRFYDTLLRNLSNDTKHVEHVQDFWGDPR